MSEVPMVRKIRCAQCRRVLASSPRQRPVPRKRRAELDALAREGRPSLAWMHLQEAEWVGREAIYPGSVTMRGLTVTASCPCGFERSYPLGHFGSLTPDADGDVYLT